MLRFDAHPSENALRSAVVECGRICYERRLMTSNDGNISVRLDRQKVLITPSGICKGRMHPEDLVLIDADGHVLGSAAGHQPSSETPMHLEVYRQQAEVHAVIHAHPVFATALTVAGLNFPNDILPETVLLLGDVPVTEFALPASAEDAAAIRPHIGTHRALLLRQHGSLTYGRDLEEALQHLERLEHVAEVFWRARALGHVEHLAPEARHALEASRDHLSHE